MADSRGVGGVFSGIVEKVSFLSQLPLLTRAISDDDEPIPGYWLEEIKKKAGCETHSTQLAEFLSVTLNNRSGRVKLKALRLMEFMSQHDFAFREAVSRDEGCLKEACKWLDPSGAAAAGLQEAVRGKAGQLLASLHNPAWVPVGARRSLPGLGTDRQQGPATGTGMQGFGRSTHREETATEKVRGLLDSLFGATESQSERCVREAFASDKGQYQRVTLDQSQPLVAKPGQRQRPADQSGGSVHKGSEGEVAEIEKFCSESRWPVSSAELRRVASCADNGAAVSALSAILERGGAAEMRALLLVEVLLRRGAAANQLRASLARLADGNDERVASKARKVTMLMDGIDADTSR